MALPLLTCHGEECVLPRHPPAWKTTFAYLCERAISAKTQPELDAILPELKAAIRDHIRYVRAVVVETIPEVFGTRIHPGD